MSTQPATRHCLRMITTVRRISDKEQDREKGGILAKAVVLLLFGGGQSARLPTPANDPFLLLFRDTISSIHPSFPPFLSFPFLSFRPHLSPSLCPIHEQ